MKWTDCRGLHLTSEIRVNFSLNEPPKYGLCNPGHNILELYNILVEIRFTTRKRKLDV